MGEVFNLALPYFGLILLGYVCGKLKRIPETGLAWMNFFIIYVALPALFFRIVAKAPLEQLSNPRFIIATSLASATAFAIGMAIRHGNLAEATLAGLAGAYGNIGYMGPGLALATLGLEAAAPTALIFCFDSILLFSLVPFLMAFAGTERKGLAAAAADVLQRIALNPFIIATLAGVLAAAAGFEPPVAVDRLLQFLQNAAAPCALFTLGLTVALRPMKRLPWEVPIIIPVKLVVHPVLALTMLTLLGPFERNWVYTAVLMAALPPALNVFVTARHYDIWVEQASGFVLFGTAASVATLTTVMWLVTTQALLDALFR